MVLIESRINFNIGAKFVIKLFLFNRNIALLNVLFLFQRLWRRSFGRLRTLFVRWLRSVSQLRLFLDYNGLSVRYLHIFVRLFLLLLLLLLFPLVLIHLIESNGIIPLLFNWLGLLQACYSAVLILNLDWFFLHLRNLINLKLSSLSHSEILQHLIGSLVIIFDIFYHLRS